MNLLTKSCFLWEVGTHLWNVQNVYGFFPCHVHQIKYKKFNFLKSLLILLFYWILFVEIKEPSKINTLIFLRSGPYWHKFLNEHLKVNPMMEWFSTWDIQKEHFAEQSVSYSENCMHFSMERLKCNELNRLFICALKLGCNWLVNLT